MIKNSTPKSTAVAETL